MMKVYICSPYRAKDGAELKRREAGRGTKTDRQTAGAGGK